ncbi:MAG: ABC transporter substrate-binding protein [Candidatus Handelsmanbacteria bacterium]|nr:ABC transporter substrate-binding protein [Candidatus Handelsmanbacteria bacterium]
MIRFAALALALALHACGSSPESGPGLKQVPRNRTLVLDCAEPNTCAGQIADFDSFNPYIPTGSSRTGWNFLYEPLYFYNPHRETDNLIPWIAQSYTFNPDYTEVEVKIRPGVTWSDGAPWTAHDLVFTIDMLRQYAPELKFSTDMQAWVKDAVAVDDLKARISLTAPNPRFVLSYLAPNSDNGLFILPEHIWKGQDPRTFANCDPAKGWPVVSGPYRLALSLPGQRIWDRRDDWWAAKTGFQRLPEVERLVFLPYMDEAKRVQKLIANELDSCLDLRPPNIKSAVDANPAISTWTGRQLPHGRLDWWTITLGFNNLEPPFNNPQIRRAIGHAIDRRQLIDVGWQGSGTFALLPFPDFPPVLEYTRQVRDLAEQYAVDSFDRRQTAAIMEDQGWRRGADGIWQKGGERFEILIESFPFLQDLAVVLVAQLQQAGFEAGFRATSDSATRITQGRARAFLYGNGGAVRDPYFTLRLYHSRFVQPTGTPAESFWRWRNAEFDRLVDQMGQIAPEDPRMIPLFRQAMEIWLGEMPSIPLVQWYHRIPHNEKYWRNWPTAENPYSNDSYWANTWLLVLLGLERAPETGG